MSEITSLTPSVTNSNATNVGDVAPLQMGALIDMTVNALDSEHTRRAYRADLRDFLDWYQRNRRTLSKATVNDYKAELQAKRVGASVINRKLSAIRKLVREAADNGALDPRTAESIAKAKGIAQRGARVGNWLTADEAEALINTPDDSTLRGKRDRALLGVLIGCGLRRQEVAALAVEHVQQREGRWVIVDLRGKRAKVRSVPMAQWTKALIDRWTQAAGIEHGAIFAHVTRGKAGKVAPMLGKTGAGKAGGKATKRIPSDATSPQSIMRAVARYGAAIGRPELRPHDLRRTFAKLARAGGAALEQIQINLGHESLDTTKRYLGTELDLCNAPADAIRLNVRLLRASME